MSIGGHEVIVCKLLQHASTVGGLALLGFWTWRWWRSASVTTPDLPQLFGERTRLVILIGIIIATAAGSVGLGVGLADAATPLKSLLTRCLVSSMTVLAGVCFLYAIGFQTVAALAGKQPAAGLKSPPRQPRR